MLKQAGISSTNLLVDYDYGILYIIGISSQSKNVSAHEKIQIYAVILTTHLFLFLLQKHFMSHLTHYFIWNNG